MVKNLYENFKLTRQNFTPQKLIVFIFLLIGFGSPAMAQRFPGKPSIGGGTRNVMPKKFKNVGIHEKLGHMVPLDIQIINSKGQTVTLKDALGNDDKPVILDLAYYNCPMLCPMIMHGLLKSVHGLDWKAGKDYKIISVSFNPLNTTHQADSLQITFQDSLGVNVPKDSWRFYTAKKSQIKRLTGAIGFNYRYYPEKKQYIHTAVLTFLSSKGKISRYLYGITFPELQLENALSDAADGHIGDTIDKLVLYCSQYDPVTGKYTANVLHIVNIGAILTMLFLGVGLTVFWIRERKKKELIHETTHKQ